MNICDFVSRSLLEEIFMLRNRQLLEAAKLQSNMFEGFAPTPKGIEIIRDYVLGKIS